MVAAAPTASAGSEAWVAAEAIQPGATQHLYFATDAPMDIEVAVDRRVNCTVTGPEGHEESPCDHSEGAITATMLDSGRTEYVFPYRVPQAEGPYQVHFEVHDLLNLPGAGYAATTSFRVSSDAAAGGGPGGSGSPGDGDGTGDGGTKPGDDGTDPGDDGTGQIGPGSDNPLFSGRDGASGKDAQRLLVGGSLATTALLAALAARRFPL